MAADSIVIGLDIQDDDVRSEVESIITSLPGIRLTTSEDRGYPDLILFELDDDHDKTFAQIHNVISTSPATEVFLTATRHDSDVLLQAIRAGVKEFIPQPIQEDELRQAFRRCKERNREQNTNGLDEGGKLINIIGGKGGVGTTTIAVNLASSLLDADREHSVVLVDLNPQFGDVALFLDLAPTHTFGDVTKNISRLDPTFLMSVLTKHNSGLYILPSANVIEEIGVLTAESAVKTLELLKSTFDYVVVDSGHSLDDITIATLNISSSVYVVTSLTLPILRNTKRFLDIFNDLGHQADEIKVIVNRYQAKNVDVSLKDLENVLKQKPHWMIPNDYFTALGAINKGEPISSVSKRSDIAKSFAELAETLQEKQEKENGKKSFLGKLFK
jgi:pilus assembly protein CpaE